MKYRIFVVILAFLVAMSFTGCTQKSDNTPLPQTSEPQVQVPTEPETIADEKEPTSEIGEDTLIQLRALMKEYGYGVSVAYLGRFSGEYEELAEYMERNGYLDRIPFLPSVPPERFASSEGDELYLVVPAEADAEIAVHDWIVDESTNYAGKAGVQVFYQSISGEPFLLRCNVSEIVPNTVICIASKNQSDVLEYSPFLSMQDGSLNAPAAYQTGYGVLDITPYPPLHSVDPEMVIGMWEGLVIPEDGRKSYHIYLELHDDGTMYYLYNLYDGTEDAVIYTYDGTWQYHDNTWQEQPQKVYDFDLALSRIIGDADEEPLERITTTQLVLNPWGDALSLQIITGDSLYPNNWEYEVYLERAA